MIRSTLVILALTVAVAMTSPVLAQDDLDSLAASVERAAATPQAERTAVDRMAKALTTSPEVLRGERESSKLGWGDLYIAHRIAALGGHPVDKVLKAKGSGAGWKQIAEEAGVDPSVVAKDVVSIWPEFAAPTPVPAPPAASEPSKDRASERAPEKPQVPADELRDRMIRGGGMRGR